MSRNAGTIAFLEQLKADLAAKIAARQPVRVVGAGSVALQHINKSRTTTRILFRPKGGRVDATLLDAVWKQSISSSQSISEAMQLAGRCKSTDFSLPRRIAGESKAIKAEGYYATRLVTDRMAAKELSWRSR